LNLSLTYGIIIVTDKGKPFDLKATIKADPILGPKGRGTKPQA